MSQIAELAAAVAAAERRIRPYVRETFVESSLHLSRLGRAQVSLKLENLQHTGSFKVRGALNKLLSLSDTKRSSGVVAASTGNHGAAVAYSLERLDAPGMVFMPEAASTDKIRAIERRGIEVRRVAGDPLEAEIRAREYADEHGMTYISPYNSREVVAGQGTIAVELERQCSRIDAVYVALGGGGLISGIAAYLKSSRPELQVVGCSPENSPVMIESIRAGRIVELESLPTLSDGTVGGVEEGAITFELCRTLVDDYVTVSEEEIADNLRSFVETHHLLIEGAAAVAVAGYLKTREKFAGRNVVIVICGGNISLETLKSIL